MDDQLLLTPERAADRLDVGRTTIYALIDSGEIESVKIGRSRRIPADALVAYVERLRRESVKPQGSNWGGNLEPMSDPYSPSSE